MEQWQKEQLAERDESPSCIKRFVDSPGFGLAVFFTITLHAIISAVGVDYRAAGTEFPLRMDAYLDIVFLLVYVIEACLRALAYGPVFLFDIWNVVDVCLIIFEMVEIWFLTSSTHIILFRILRS